MTAPAVSPPGSPTPLAEVVSPDGLTVRARHHHNPYGYLLSGAGLDALLLDLGLRRAASIWRQHHISPAAAPRDPYPRLSMGFVLLDPTADRWVRHEDAVLGAIAIGDEGHRFLPNAAAKAAGHRRLDRNYGEAVHTDPHLCGDGAFRYGHSAEVRGLIVGASAQSPDQDLYEASLLAQDFIAELADRHAAWETTTGATDWLAPNDRPAPGTAAMTAFFTAGAS
ncbi:hypothetical protein ACFOZ0_14530 [Streptomyces yaanensis]|uniref:Uncharacterized protein n=1 Tax=Streptomyces yaanensis TaxID=1142239 RepID=A0ABV7SE53_9ACTN|nr:hypothetical protein [Streptomyces sp. CGMCC 4.7035]WNB98698.1 hypothetical protein Q2K21_11780 [Streptomyces sp. CGMCC 4.7035]